MTTNNIVPATSAPPILEQQLIGAAMLNLDSVLEFQNFVSVQYFTDPILGMVWKNLARLDKKTQNGVVEATLQDEGCALTRDDLWTLLAECMQTATDVDAQAAAESLREEGLRRATVQFAETLKSMATMSNVRIGQIQSYIERSVRQLNLIPNMFNTDAAHLVDSFLNRFEQGVVTEYIPTGISSSLDREFGGWAIGDVALLAGWTGSGKTALAMSSVYHVAKWLKKNKDPRKIVVISFEMDKDKLIRDMLAMESEVWYQVLTGRFKASAKDLEALRKAQKSFPFDKIIMHDKEECLNWTFPEMVRCIRRDAYIHGQPVLVVIDAFWLMKHENPFEERSDQFRIHLLANSLSGLLSMAKVPTEEAPNGLGCAMLVPWQLARRPIKGEIPELDDIRGAITVAQSASTIFAAINGGKDRILHCIKYRSWGVDAHRPHLAFWADKKHLYYGDSDYDDNELGF